MKQERRIILFSALFFLVLVLFIAQPSILGETVNNEAFTSNFIGHLSGLTFLPIYILALLYFVFLLKKR